MTWEQRNNGLSLDPYSAGIIRVGNQLFTSLKFGGSDVYHSFDDGLNWEDFGGGLGFFTIISKFVYHDGILYVITSNGLWEREIVATAVDESAAKSTGLQLSQNHPNPFTDGTNINFTIQEAGHVRLVVYDDQGSLIRTIVNENISAGNYEYLWDGKDAKGHPAATGPYFYRLDANNLQAMKRMIKIKYSSW